MQTDVLMLVNLTPKRLASRGASSHKFTAGSQKGAMVEEKAALILDSQENEEITLHPPRGPRFEPQKEKLSSTTYSKNVKITCTRICRKKSVGKKYINPLRLSCFTVQQYYLYILKGQSHQIILQLL